MYLLNNLDKDLKVFQSINILKVINRGQVFLK